MRAEVEEAGWTFVHLTTADVTSKAALLDRAAAAFGFAGWFGRNWDAFRDSLGDVRAERGTLVLWDGWDEFARADEEAFAIALELVRERAEGETAVPSRCCCASPRARARAGSRARRAGGAAPATP